MDVVGADLLIFQPGSASKMNHGKPRSILSRLGQQRHVGRRLAEGRSGGLIVRIGFGTRNVVGWRSRDA